MMELDKSNYSHSIIPHQCLLRTPQGFSVNPRYSLVKDICEEEASPSQVKLYLDTFTQTPVVIKKVSKRKLLSPAQVVSAERELKIHRSLQHLNIVECFDTGETDSDYLLMLEYITKYDYFVDRLEVNNKPFNIKGDVEKLRSFSYDILSGLEYLHSNNVIHMDLKPANIMLQPESNYLEYPIVKIGDFGLSRRCNSSGGVFIDKQCGTDKYVAPEVRDGAWVTHAVDMWCYGLILHNLTVGFSPYVLKWTPGKPLTFNPRYWRKYEGTYLTDLISSCLCLHPSDRITAAQALEHPWFDFENS